MASTRQVKAGAAYVELTTKDTALLKGYINSSVMVMPSNSAEYYFPPKYPVPSNYWAVEQLYLSINLQLHDAPLKELDRRFNWCWCHKRFEEDMHRAFIIHWAGKHDRLTDLNDSLSCSGTAHGIQAYDSVELSIAMKHFR